MDINTAVSLELHKRKKRYFEAQDIYTQTLHASQVEGLSGYKEKRIKKLLELRKGLKDWYYRELMEFHHNFNRVREDFIEELKKDKV